MRVRDMYRCVPSKENSRVGVGTSTGEGGDSGDIDGDDEVGVGVLEPAGAEASFVEGSCSRIRQVRHGQGGDQRVKRTITTRHTEGLGVAEGDGGEGGEDDGETHGENEKRVREKWGHRAERELEWK